MDAGSALGLLAGLGAINALRGGKDGRRFTSLIDMIDGGGAGRSGDKFEGGGLLSMLGNLFAKPYEAQDNVERIAANTAAAKTVAPMLRPKDRPSEEERLMGMPVQAMSAEDRLMGMPVQANPLYAQAAAEAGMGLDPFGGDGVKDVYGIGRGGEYANLTPIPEQPNVSTGLLDQQPVYTIDQYLRSINVPITPQTRAQYMPQLMAQFGLNK